MASVILLSDSFLIGHWAYDKTRERMVATGSPERITEWGSGSGLNILRTLFNLILNNSLAIIIPVLQMKKRDSEIEQFSLTSQAALMWRTKLKTQVCLTANTTILNYLFVMSVKFK